MSIRWIRNVIVDDEKTIIEVQLGDHHIGDKCYVRMGAETEMYFDNMNDARDDIVAQGIDILKTKLQDKKVTYPDGRDYDWR
jgi:hypothetical protein